MHVFSLRIGALAGGFDRVALVSIPLRCRPPSPPTSVIFDARFALAQGLMRRAKAFTEAMDELL
jgi:hypothetical protein